MILFRHLADPLPPYWEPIHWQVEYFPDEEVGAPYGVAWVVRTEFLTLVEYVLVRDEHRGKGVAKAILLACFERWPDCRLTDAISPGGQALLDSVDR